MTNEELEAKLRNLVKRERRITNEILNLIQEAESRRLYLEKGHASAYSWLVKDFGLSQTSAHRRIQSSRLCREFPEIGRKLESGCLNLCGTTLMQSTFSREERRSGKKIKIESKNQIIRNAEGKTLDHIQKLLAEAFPESVVRDESFRPLGNEASKLSIVLDELGSKNLKRLKEVLSHSHPDASWSQLIEICLEDFLNRKDPLRKMTHPVSDAETGCSIPSNIRRLVLQRAKGQCEFTNEVTSQRCESRFQIEVDHIVPKAHGGPNRLENLRALCRPHNQFEAERILGTETMQAYRART